MRQRSNLAVIVSLLALAMCGCAVTTCSADTANDMQQAQTLFGAGNYDAAIQILKGVEADSAFAFGAKLILGSCYQAKGDYQKSIDYFEAILAPSAAPDSIKKEALMALGRSYQLSVDPANAISTYRSFIAAYPEDARGQLWLGVCYQEQKRYPDSVAPLEKALSLVPGEDPGLLKQVKFALAAACHLSGNLDKAISTYQAYLAQFPEDAARAQYWLGSCYQEMKRYPEGVAALETAVALIPSGDSFLTEANYSLLISYCLNGDIEKAEPLYRANSAAFASRAASAEIALGRCYQSRGNADEATVIYKDIAASYPTAAEAREALLRVGDCLWIQNKYDDAITYLDKLGADHPDILADAQFMKAETLDSFKGDYEQAISVLGQLVSRLAADNPVARKARIRAALITLFGLHQPSDARQQLNLLVTDYQALGLDTAELEYHLGFCSFSEGKCSEAREAFRQVCASRPKDFFTASKYMIGECSIALKDFTTARVAFDELIRDYPGTPEAAGAALRINQLPALSAARGKLVAEAAKPLNHSVEVLHAKTN